MKYLLILALLQSPILLAKQCESGVWTSSAGGSALTCVPVSLPTPKAACDHKALVKAAKAHLEASHSFGAIPNGTIALAYITPCHTGGSVACRLFRATEELERAKAAAESERKRTEAENAFRLEVAKCDPGDGEVKS